MDPAAIGMVLLVVGILMLISEVTIPGFFIAIPGTVLVVLGVIGIVLPDVFISSWTPIIILAIGVPTFVITIWAYMRFGPTSEPVTTVATSLVGRVGKVTRDVEPDALKGKVKIDHQIWSATADHLIPSGTRVKVVKSEGVHVVVEELSEEKIEEKPIEEV